MSTMHRVNPDLSLPNLIWTFGSAVIRVVTTATTLASSAATAASVALVFVASIIAAIWKDVAFCAVCIGLIALFVAQPLLLVGLGLVALFGVATWPREAGK